MRPLQAWARDGRIRFFLPFIRDGEDVLEIGSGDGWFRRAVEASRSVSYLTIDLRSGADIQGDIRDWRKVGLQPESFDVVIAFEVVEHTDCFRESLELLKPGGLLLITTPMPHADWLLKLLELLRLAQRRTSPHSNLVYLRSVRGFSTVEMRTPYGLVQWAVFRKPHA